MLDNNSHTAATSSLKATFLKKRLQKFHVQFVIVPTDKANRNGTFICKHLYINVLIKELGIGPDGMSGNSGTSDMY